MSTQNLKETLFKILRWISILPSSIIVFLIARGLFNVMIHFLWREDGDDPFMLKYVAPLIYCGVAGYASISVGWWLAPNYKKHAVLILLLLYTLITGAVIFMYFAYTYISVGSLLEAIGQLIGSVIAYIKINNDEELL